MLNRTHRNVSVVKEDEQHTSVLYIGDVKLLIYLNLINYSI